MIKKFIFLSLCLFSSYDAEASEAYLENPQAGRYQIAVREGKIILLDTAKGYVWQAKQDWLDRFTGEWEPLIMNPPQ